MDNQNVEIRVFKKASKNGKGQLLGSQLQMVSLRDIPLEVRRKEARKPLFLIRYE
jgi:hypothetical protein